MPTATERAEIAAALAGSIASEAESPDADLIAEAARLAEVGKLYVPAASLHAAPADLDDDARAALASHFEHGHALARGAGVPDRACAWILNARERWDGGGPTGLAGSDIPFGSRVIAVCLTYLEAPAATGEGDDPREVALSTLAELSGSGLDPALTEIAIRVAAAPEPFAVREALEADRDRLGAFLADNDSARVTRRGELLDPLDHPIVIAERDGELVGVLTWMRGDPAEVLTLHAASRQEGIGTALLEAVVERAGALGSTRLRVRTTNDNTDALRFFQRRGFRLRALEPGAAESARASLKPEIPTTGEYGIYIRDELELERDV
jgi:GNAT superfamily N-acetyltransferase